jgi:hypothetical protein
VSFVVVAAQSAFAVGETTGSCDPIGSDMGMGTAGSDIGFHENLYR